MNIIKDRYKEIDIAAGIAIALVVFGHMHFTETIQTKWYMIIRDIVYKIHMPLFIFLSGFIAFLSVAKIQITGGIQYRKFIAGKAKKFIPAYLFFGFLAIAIDLFFRHIPSDQILYDLNALVFFPIKGSAGFIWYLYVLFGFYLITPFIIRIKIQIITILFVLSFFLTFVELSPYFSLYLFSRYLFFFLGGGLFYHYYSKLAALIQKYGLVFFMLFIIALGVELKIHSLSFQLLSICFIPAILYLSDVFKRYKVSKIVSHIGQGSYAIYLLNSIAINILYILFHRIFKPFPVPFFVMIGMILALTLPLVFRYYFNRIIPKRFYIL